MQHHCAGVYADPLYDLASINLIYSRLHFLLTGAAKIHEPLRWLMLESNFRGDRGIVDLDEVRHGTDWREALRPTESEAEIFRSVAEGFQAISVTTVASGIRALRTFRSTTAWSKGGALHEID